MPRGRKSNQSDKEQTKEAPASYVVKVPILRQDGKRFDVGEDVTNQFGAEKIKSLLERGLIE